MINENELKDLKKRLISELKNKISMAEILSKSNYVVATYDRGTRISCYKKKTGNVTKYDIVYLVPNMIEICFISVPQSEILNA